MKSTARTYRIMEYIVVVWILLLSFYWTIIANLMNNTSLFFGVAVVTFLVGCSYLFFMQQRNRIVKKGLLIGCQFLTLSATTAALLLAPSCVCKLIEMIDLLPQCIAFSMVTILYFTRPL